MTRLIYRIIKKRDDILKLADEHGVANVRVFGSVSRGQEKDESDIDLLVDVVKKPDGTRGNFITFGLAVRKLFKHRRVEVCTSETLHPRFRDKVLKKCISIMEDDPVIDMNEKDERDYVVNIMKTQEYLKDFHRLAKIGRDKVIGDTDLRAAFGKHMQQAAEEMVRSIPKTLKRQIPEIDWEGLRDFRNFIVHHYDNVEWETMWIVSLEKMEVVELACSRLLEVLGEK